MTSLSLLLALTFVPAVAPASATVDPIVAHPLTAPDAFDDGRARITERFVQELDDLAQFCQKKRAFEQRNRVYTFLLDYDPDHQLARKTLGYKWDRKAKKWLDPKRPKTPRDADAEMAVEAKQRFTAVIQDHRDRMVALIDQHEDDLSPSRIDREAQQLLKLLPEDAELRAMRGQVKTTIDGKERWVSREFARTNERRNALKAWKKAANADLPHVEEGSVESWEEDLGIAWSGCDETSRIRVVGTIGQSERQRIAQQVDLMWDFVEELTGSGLEHSYTIYVVTSDADWSKIIDNWPDNNRDKDFLRQLGGFWFGPNACIRRGSYKELRVDTSMGAASRMYTGSLYGINSDHAWIQEGFALYQTKFLLGTRLTFSVKPSEYTDQDSANFASRLSGSKADWLKMCKDLLQKKKAPKLPFTLGRDVNQITGDDILIGYAIVAFLLEGNEPDTFAKVATKIGREGMSSVEALESTLGYDIEVLRRRLIDWLNEVA